MIKVSYKSVELRLAQAALLSMALLCNPGCGESGGPTAEQVAEAARSGQSVIDYFTLLAAKSCLTKAEQDAAFQLLASFRSLLNDASILKPSPIQKQLVQTLFTINNTLEVLYEEIILIPVCI